MAGKKLLVADDSLTIQKVIRLALSNEGYEIQAVSDGNDAIQQISLFRPDAVLIDVSLPGKSAFEVKRAINEHSDLEEVRFILMSSAFEKVDEPQASEVRFHGRLTKPFDPAHLRQVLTETLAQVEALRKEPTSILQRPVPTPEPMVMPPALPPALPVAPPALPTSTFNPEFAPPPLPSFSAPQMPPALPSPEPQEIEIGDDWLQAPSLQSSSPSSASTPPPPSSTSSADEDTIQLWDQPEEPSLAPPPTPPHGGERDADIKHLTESTIRMSGLDDFDWSVSEPSLKPPEQMLDTGGTSFEIEPFKPEFIPEISNVAEAAPDPTGAPPTLDKIPMPPVVASSPSDFYRDPGDVTKKLSRPSPLAPPSAPTETSVVGISSDQIEEMLRKELQKLLPDLAEKIIKQEIHRMLSSDAT